MSDNLKLSPTSNLMVCVLDVDVEAVSTVIAEAVERDPLVKPNDSSPIAMLLSFIRNCAIRAAYDRCSHSALDIIEVLNEVDAISSKVRYEH